MPKRCLSIIFVAFAAVLLTAVHTFPHHHHAGEAPCFAAVCGEAGHDGAGELPHQHNSEPTDDDTCFVEDSRLFSFEQNETKLKAESSGHDHSPHAHLFFASCCLAAIASLYEAESEDDSSGYGGRDACLYRSVDANRDNGLRAPPRPLV
jgi:hypothetical protein